MGWRGTCRTATSAALAGAVALVLAAAPQAGAEPRSGAAPSFGTVAARPDASPAPLPPRLPRDFRGKGKWIVRDLGITVPFTWEGRDGESRMVAGGPQYPIWFTNLIYHGTLYTLTYKWPGLDDHPCSRIPGFSLEDLNQALEGSRFVGRETLRRTPERRVNHWRVGVVFPQLPPGNHPRLPLALGDIYVDENDRGTFWQVLQFGVQNLYDPELDEWLVMDTFEHRPGTVTLPRECEPPRP
ncbi:hypothetical protein K7B10_36775 [Streptomyces flavotricini]|uniref:Uncharacterized protein n=1 Tax=Streptomyces flavotricini TaxID=66888 RepID=A0ABS8EHR2_9ACTN|nr:hypothetical protein [Streptomyces flavotricini]MCC0100239.1 hypothetical protein [Streptomyces flavotricini]